MIATSQRTLSAQHTTKPRNKQSFPRRDSNPWSQPSSGCRSTLYTPRPPGSTLHHLESALDFWAQLEWQSRHEIFNSLLTVSIVSSSKRSINQTWMSSYLLRRDQRNLPPCHQDKSKRIYNSWDLKASHSSNCISFWQARLNYLSPLSLLWFISYKLLFPVTGFKHLLRLPTSELKSP